MSWPQALCLVAVLLCLSCLGTTVKEKKARITPVNLYVEAGYSMEANCTLQAKGIALGLTSSDLSFWYKKWNTTGIASHYVTRPDNTTATLMVPNVPASKDQHQLWCIGNYTDKLDAVYLRVGYKPKASRILSVTADNWKTVTITWEKENNPVFRTTTTAHWKANNEPQFQVCPNQQNIGTIFSCWFSLTSRHLAGSTYFQIMIYSSNRLGNFTTRPEMSTFYLADINKPQGVQNMDVSKKGISWIYVSWMSAAPLEKTLVYATNASCQRSEQRQILTTSEHFIMQNITGLQPGTHCRIAVAAHAEHSNIWSDPAIIYETTRDSVPSGFPLTTRGGFDVQTSDSERKITLYWQPMPVEQRRGNITKYKITRRSRHRSTLRTYEDEVAATECCQHAMSVDMDEAYNISVAARTSAGYNETLSPQQQVVVLPQALLELQSPKNVTAVVTGDNMTEVRWSSKESNEFTGYWCKMSRSNDGKRCAGSVSWVKGISSPWRVDSLTAHRHRHRSSALHWFHFGVSSDFETNSSGITWSDCTYDLSKTSQAPVVLTTTTSSGFSVQMKHPVKCRHRPGFIYAYKVTYCELEENHCAGESVTVTVPRTGKKTTWEVDGLLGDTMYQLTVNSITAAGISSSSRTSTIRIPSGGTVVNNLPIILVVCSVGVIFLVIGIVCFVWKCGRKCRFYGKKLKIPIQLPPEESQPEAAENSAVPYHNVSAKHEAGKKIMPPPIPPIPNKSDTIRNLPPAPRHPLPSIPNQKQLNNSGVLSLYSQDSGIGGPLAVSSSEIHAPSCQNLIFSGDRSEPSNFSLLDETAEQNKHNAELDDDYNCAPALLLNIVGEGALAADRQYSGCPVGELDESQEEGSSSSAQSSSEKESSCASSSGDESGLYKEAAMLLDPQVSHSDLLLSSYPGEGEEDKDEDDYKPALLVHDLWPPGREHSLPHDSQSSGPLLSHLPPGSEIPLNQFQLPTWAWTGEPGSDVPLVLLSSMPAEAMTNGVESGSELLIGIDQTQTAEEGREHSDSEDSDDYGYMPIGQVASPM